MNEMGGQGLGGRYGKWERRRREEGNTRGITAPQASEHIHHKLLNSLP